MVEITAELSLVPPSRFIVDADEVKSDPAATAVNFISPELSPVEAVITLLKVALALIASIKPWRIAPAGSTILMSAANTV